MAPDLPEFLIVGAAKCGTTSLYAYLRDHPDVFMPSEVKEPTFYATPEAGGLTDEAAYRALFLDAAPDQLRGEASVAYLYDSEAPQRIRTSLGPETRIVILLRNPADMAYSLWGHNRRLGVEPLSFEQALEEEASRAKDPKATARFGTWVGNVLYLDRATYMPQINRYLQVFSRDQIAIYIFEEFFSEKLPQWEDLCSFLGVSPTPRPQPVVHNPAGTVRSQFLRQVYSQRLWWKEPLKLILPASIRALMMASLQKFNRKEQRLPPMSNQTRAWIQEKTQSDVNTLGALLNRSDLHEIWY